jgi:hypothetical protein
MEKDEIFDIFSSKELSPLQGIHVDLVTQKKFDENSISNFPSFVRFEKLKEKTKGRVGFTVFEYFPNLFPSHKLPKQHFSFTILQQPIREQRRAYPSDTRFGFTTYSLFYFSHLVPNPIEVVYNETEKNSLMYASLRVSIADINGEILSDFAAEDIALSNDRIFPVYIEKNVFKLPLMVRHVITQRSRFTVLLRGKSSDCYFK